MARIGTAEWLEEMSAKVSTEAQPQLIEIATNAAQRHGADKIHLSQPDTVRMAMVLSETQDQSFLLGIQLGLKLMMGVLQLPDKGEQGREDPESETR